MCSAADHGHRRTPELHHPKNVWHCLPGGSLPTDPLVMTFDATAKTGDVERWTIRTLQ